jgi:malate synthase
MTVRGPVSDEFSEILTPDALQLVADLHREFDSRRLSLLQDRYARQERIDAGETPDFLSSTENVRNDDTWKTAGTPDDLQRRHAEITGPVERKMIINALNSGANTFMADFEDATSPTWANLINGQINLRDAIRRQIDFTTPEGREYKLDEEIATLLVRPRGWHLSEKNVLVDGSPVSGSLFDFGLYFFHNARELLERGSGPYFYLPKLESHLEARLWNDVFVFAQDRCGVPQGSIRATVLIETILAAFEMEEILHELRDHSAGLNAGRWDYIFSVIKKFRNRPGFALPDRAQVTMTVPFMRAYSELLVRTCHKRGAHAMGGMAAFIPSRRDPAVNEIALRKVREDKERESGDGFDGTWVAHPDLVGMVREIFEETLGGKDHQKHRLREDVQVEGADLLDFQVPLGAISEQGLRDDICIGLQYVESWLGGLGCVPIFNLMEDAATAEISRSQLWQWVHSDAGVLDDGREVTAELYRQLVPEELDRIKSIVGDSYYASGNYEAANQIIDNLVVQKEFTDFLTLVAYEQID